MTTYSDKLVAAFELTYRLHARQERRGSKVPYLTHLMAVASIVGEYGGDEDQAIAGLLHDAVEDQGGQTTLAHIRARFGDRVARLVEGCSDAHTTPKPPWEERKMRFIRDVADAPADVKLVVAADKLHNARSILKDLRDVGEELWDRFNGGREPTLWYCKAVVSALAQGWEHPLLRDLEKAERELQRLAAETARATQHDAPPSPNT